MFPIKNGKKSKELKFSSNTLIKLSIFHALRKKRWIPGTFILKKAIENVRPLFTVRKNRNFVQVIPLNLSMQKN